MYMNKNFYGQIKEENTLGFTIFDMKENNNIYFQQSNKAYNLYDLIYNLDKPVTFIPKENIDSELPFKFTFLEEMSNETFIQLFTDGINFIKNKWSSKNLSILKKLFFELENNNKIKPDKLFFSFLNEKNDNRLDIVYKKDFILSLFLHPPLLNNKINTNDNELYQNYYNSKIKEISLYLNFETENIIEFNDKFQMKLDSRDISYAALKNFIFNKEYFIKTVTSNCLISCYKDLLKFFYPNMYISTEEMKNKLYEYLMLHKIYFVDMSIGLYGLTLYNGTILINNKFCKNTDLNNSPYICIIFLTLLHEMAHVSVRIFRNEKNYFYNTFFEIDKNMDNNLIKKLNINNFLSKNKFIEESGFFFEEIFLWSEFEKNNLNNYKYISHLDSIFIFNFNYTRDYRIFRQCIKVNRDISGDEKIPSFLKFSVEKRDTSLNIYLSPDRCINANLRLKIYKFNC